MKTDYTNKNESYLSSFFSKDYFEEGSDENEVIRDYLNDPQSFRPFSEGLIAMMRKKSVPINVSDADTATSYLYDRLRDIGASVEKETIRSWFTGKHRPKIESGSRKRIYEICFALQLNYAETAWFFRHVYFDRPFYHHDLNECVFSYAFLHNLSYGDALCMIDRIKNTDLLTPDISQERPDYTRFFADNIHQIDRPEELEKFLIQNRLAFDHWNDSAISEMRRMLSEIRGPEDHYNDIYTVKKKARQDRITPNDLKQLHSLPFGLLLQEVLYDAENNAGRSWQDHILDVLDKNNPSKNAFLLNYILSTSSGMPNAAQVPYVVKVNFPSKKSMSDILDEAKGPYTRSYDAIRKMIILLDFYIFWVRAKLGISDLSNLNKEDAFQIYRDEADARLFQCNYEPLYAGNPYDWIFLCSARAEDPLSWLRTLISDLTEN